MRPHRVLHLRFIESLLRVGSDGVWNTLCEAAACEKESINVNNMNKVESSISIT